jgi:uncharacterized protein (DUF427 family)
MAERGRVRVEPGHKWVRVALGGETIAETRNPLLVWEKPYYPTYFFPADDVRTDLLIDTGETKRSPSRGTAQLHNIKPGSAEAPRAASWYPESPIPEIAGHYRFEWQAMDHWYEEDEEVYVHPRDPYTRVDTIRSSRHVRIEVDGTTIAESRAPTLVFETGLPTRYYFPKTHVRMDLLRKTDTATECPYKGTAEYWSIDVGGTLGHDLVWSYPFPTAEAAKIAGLMGFYNEKIDIYVDGELEERPKTKFS